MSQIIRFLKFIFDFVLGNQITLGARGDLTTTTSIHFVPLPSIGNLTKNTRVVTYRLSSLFGGNEMDISIGYVGSDGEIKYDVPVFRSTPQFHIDVAVEKVAPIIYNTSPRGCKVMFVGNGLIGVNTPNCSISVVGEINLIFTREKITYLLGSFSINLLTVIAVYRIFDKYLEWQPYYSLLILFIVLFISFLDYRNRLKVKDDFVHDKILKSIHNLISGKKIKFVKK